MDLSTPAGLQALLSSTPYACVSLVPLTGGLLNVTLRGTLAVPLKGGSTTVIVKHAESFPALAEGISWDAIRLVSSCTVAADTTESSMPRNAYPSSGRTMKTR